MKSYGQFCSFARALDFLGERWTLLIVRVLAPNHRREGSQLCNARSKWS